MHDCRVLNREGQPGGAGQAATAFKPPRLSYCAGIILILALTGMAQNPTVPGGELRMDRMNQVTPINQAPDPNTQMLMHDQQSKQQNFAAANKERRKQIADDSARLVKLATDLKDEVYKATKDTLSLNVIRKADDIEKLAHSVKEKMKLTVAAN
jgi:hypothetical protein